MAKVNDPLPDREELEKRLGQVIQGKWTLERLIGAGGMAAVYAAKHEIGRKEAIKILHADVARDREMVARFKREAHAVNRFSHPGVVEIRDIDETEDGEPFLVMELLEGESLARKLKTSVVEPDDALSWIDQLLDVLAAAHHEGVVHRDIKPSNLFVEKSGKLKVLDFGVAHLRFAPGTLVTDAGTTLGTVAYMPPEQLRGEDVDRKSDIYAVGATLFRLIAGENVHEGEGEDEQAQQILKGPARSLADAAPDAPEGLVRVADRALAHVAGRRYPDAETMQTDVRALLNGEPPPFATARMAAGDDPRDLAALAPGDEPRAASDDDEAETAKPPAASDTDIDEDGLTDRVAAGQDAEAGRGAVAKTLIDDEDETTVRKDAAPEIDQEAPTKLRRGDDDARGRPGKTEIADDLGEMPTRVKKTAAPSELPREEAAPRSISQLQPEEGGGKGLVWVLLILLVGLLVVYTLRDRDDETLPPPVKADAPPVSAAATAPPAPSSVPSVPVEPTASASGAPSAEPSSAPAKPAPGGAKPPPLLPSGLPTIPSSLPKTWPTALPSTLPWPPATLPSALRPPQPPPPPAPPPAPPAPPAPKGDEPYPD